MSKKQCANCGTERVPVREIKNGAVTKNMSPWLPCEPCGTAERLEAREKERRLDREAELNKRRAWVRDSGCSPLARHLTLKEPGCVISVRESYSIPLPVGIPGAIRFKKEQKEARQALLRIERGTNIFAYGVWGSGKSVLAQAACIDCCRRGLRAEYLSELSLYDHIRRYSNETPNAAELFATVPILFIDELGQSKISEWHVGLLIELLNKRLQLGKGTVLVSNDPITGKALERYGGALKSRVEGFFQSVEIRGRDMRLVK